MSKKSTYIAVTLGALAGIGAIYFFFFRKKNNGKEEGQQAQQDVNPLSVQKRPEYKGRKKFESEWGLSFSKGFDMPDNIDGLRFIANEITVITKPNTNGLFGGVDQLSMIPLFREGDKLGFKGKINGEDIIAFENYDDVKDKIVLTKNTYLKNFNYESQN
jgi:hypothetical protein